MTKEKIIELLNKSYIMRLKKYIDSDDDFYDELSALIEQEKKEQAKEIFKKLHNHYIELTAYGCDSTQHTGYYDYKMRVGDVVDDIESLAKEYAVDL